MQTLTAMIQSAWDVTVEMSPYLIIGFVLAGVLRSFLNPDLITRHLGKKSTKSVALASIIGVPLPLCSCSVLPVAAGLRKQGASSGAVSSFLISTPESGVDSIAISWGLLDPLMTIFRPVAAFVTAFIAGIAENAFGIGGKQPMAEPPKSCCSSSKPTPEEKPCCSSSAPPKPGLAAKLAEGMKFVWHDLLPMLAGWLLVMVAITGVLNVLMPDDLIGSSLGSGYVQMLLMLVIGIPIYVCATASTPIAAALVLKGLSPGAALVFLLAGPATNLATMGVVRNLLGTRALVIYIISIAVSALGLGVLLDLTYGWLSITPVMRMGSEAHNHIVSGVFGNVLAGVFLAVMVYAFAHRLVMKFRKTKSCCS